MPTQEEGMEIAESAFQPYQCIVTRPDFSRQLKFQVFDHDGGKIYNSAGYAFLDSDLLENDPLLSTILTRARKTIKGKGYALDPWEHPHAS